MCFSEGWTLLIILLQIALVNQGVMLLRTDQAFTFLDFCKLCESLTKAYLRGSSQNILEKVIFHLCSQAVKTNQLFLFLFLFP